MPLAAWRFTPGRGAVLRRRRGAGVSVLRAPLAAGAIRQGPAAIRVGLPRAYCGWCGCQTAPGTSKCMQNSPRPSESEGRKNGTAPVSQPFDRIERTPWSRRPHQPECGFPAWLALGGSRYDDLNRRVRNLIAIKGPIPPAVRYGVVWHPRRDSATASQFLALQRTGQGQDIRKDDAKVGSTRDPECRAGAPRCRGERFRGGDLIDRAPGSLVIACLWRRVSVSRWRSGGPSQSAHL
jgi:hypothetical protein